MFFLLGCVGWALMVAGALPKPGQHWIEHRVSWWSARWASAASGLIEATLGYFLLRSFLIEIGVEDALPTGGAARAVLGLFITTQGSAAGSLPLLAIWRLIAALARRRSPGSSPTT